MKVRYQGQEVQRRVVGYLPPDSWKQGKVIGRSQECVEMRSIMDKAYQEYHEACAFVVNNLGQELTRTALNRRLGRANNHKDLRFSEAVDLYLEAHPAPQSKATEFITLNHFETRVYFIPHIKILKTLRS